MIPGTNTKQKIMLILIGSVLSFLLLEVGMRLAGSAILTMQGYRNYSQIKKEGTFRILCLGESTTADSGNGESYPSQLVGILNSIDKETKFSVINKGMVSCSTDDLLSDLESNLDKYEPDLVISMIGINDGDGFILYEKSQSNSILKFTNHFKIFKLFRFIEGHFKEKFMNGKKRDQTPLSYTEEKMGHSFKEPGKLSDNENDNAGETLIKTQKEVEPEEPNSAWKKEILKEPQYLFIYSQVADRYKKIGAMDIVEEIWKKAVDLNPESALAHAELANFHLYNGNRRDLADQVWEKALKKHPEHPGMFYNVGHYYLFDGKDEKALEAWQQGIRVDPKFPNNYRAIGYYYLSNDKFEKAEEVFKKALESIPGDERLLGGLAVFLEEQNKSPLSKEYFKMANEVRENQYHPQVKSNYEKLYNILSKRGIKLAAMQYPMRSVRPLKRMLNGKEGVIYIDNEEIFKKAVRKGSFKKYFTDQMGGDFGHCSYIGNRLLATNIANVLMSEIFQKPQVGKNLLKTFPYGNKEESKQALSFENYLNEGLRLRDENLNRLAKEKFRQAIKLNPRHSWAYDELGQILMGEGKLYEAEEMFKKVIDLSPQDESGYAHLGQCYLSGKRMEEAKWMFSETLKINPNSLIAQESMKKILN